MDNRAVGVFDSGIGGLTVVKEIMKILPNEDIIYFGDTARVPYGSKSTETITKFSFQNTRFLMSMNVKAIVVACNTASALSLEKLQDEFKIPIIGVIEPGANMAVKATLTNRIGIIGTEGTIGSRAYEKAIKKLKPEAELFAYPCPLFVPIVEEGWAQTEVSLLVAKEYLKPLRQLNIDTLVMGCTHYPLLTNVVSEVMGKSVKLINPAEATAAKLKEILYANNLQNNINKEGNYKYYVSDNPGRFSTVGGRFLNSDITEIIKIDIEKY
ncbi:glutamate racemase [Caloramator sp. E03]|uniref:glutamate racemase n=1 Tax=Caloramator sp. E03 TaxID=2576307 RepID=UPI00111004D4|nr:glutamate racemase [Caloramator sp. E03]QCX33408.1 glutamate racemase [Caloramator sp. E03]